MLLILTICETASSNGYHTMSPTACTNLCIVHCKYNILSQSLMVFKYVLLYNKPGWPIKAESDYIVVKNILCSPVNDMHVVL